MSLQKLPPSLTSVALPKFLSPSHFAELQQCPLKVFVNAGADPGTLPPSPRALYGIMLHHVREQIFAGRSGTARDSLSAFFYVFDTASVQMDSFLESDPRLTRVRPLARTIGRVRWNTLRFELHRWAQRVETILTDEPPKPLLPLVSKQTDTYHKYAHIPYMEFGSEAWIVCPSLRIRGRVDLITEASDGALEISEFKSGVILDDNENPIERHTKQVRLYALAAECVFPKRPIRIYLEGSERINVPWTDEIRLSISAELKEMLDRFPANAEHSARELGRPGTWCRGCQLRPICSSYLDAAPDWWMNTGNPPRPLPLDVWGKVQDLKRENETFTLEVVDSSGRIIRIEGLDPVRGIGTLQTGDLVYLFDLEPSEPLVLHGARIHPRNFHELPPDGGLSFERARSLQVYKRGPEPNGDEPVN